jgi:anti-sigma-K factor RskA
MDQIRQPGAAGRQPARSTWLQTLQRALVKATPAWSLVSLVLVVALAANNLFLWQRLDRLESVQANTLRTIVLQGTQSSPYATGLLVISLDGEHGTLVVDRLKPLGEDQQYQLWLTRDGQRTDGGVFSVDEDGYGAKWIKASDPLASYTGFGVTVEPAGGSPYPTGDRVLGGGL